MEHAKLSPSSAVRWLSCTAAPSMEAGMPEPPVQDYTQEGTDAHNLAEWILNGNDEAEYTGPKVAERELLDVYLDFVRELSGRGDLYIETKLNLTSWVPEGFGTADAIVVDHDNETIHVADLKFGRGAVEVEDNPQLKLYGLGALDEFMPFAKTVVLWIVSPRAGGVKSWEIDASDLRDWGETVVYPQALKAFGGQDVVFAPGPDTCQWCLAQSVCTARAEQQMAEAKDVFRTFDPEDHKLTPEQVGQVVAAGREFKAWFDAIEKGAYEALDAGREVPGFKLVPGKATRSWSGDEDSIIEAFKKAKLDESDYMAPSKLRTVAQVEKQLGRKAFQEKVSGLDLVTTGRQRPSMVPQDDPRPGVDRAADAATVFTATTANQEERV